MLTEIVIPSLVSYFSLGYIVTHFPSEFITALIVVVIVAVLAIILRPSKRDMFDFFGLEKHNIFGDAPLFEDKILFKNCVVKDFGPVLEKTTPKACEHCGHGFLEKKESNVVVEKEDTTTSSEEENCSEKELCHKDKWTKIEKEESSEE